MSVSSCIYMGPTLEIATNLSYADFRKCDAFIEKHPEIDEYAYNLYKEPENKLVLIVDGMNGHYARLIYINQCRHDAHESYNSKITELANANIPTEIYEKMKALYEEYTGTEMLPEQIKYAMWTHWS